MFISFRNTTQHTNYFQCPDGRPSSCMTIGTQPFGDANCILHKLQG